MANRYWVGGTGTWDSSNTTNWSTTSGGAGGASVPTVSDDAFFDANSGAGTVTVSPVSIKSIDTTGFTGTINFGNQQVSIYGGLVIGAGTTIPSSTYFSLVGGGLYGGTTFNVDINNKTISGITIAGSASGKLWNFISGFAMISNGFNLTYTANCDLAFNNITVSAAMGGSGGYRYLFQGSGNVNFGTATFQGLPTDAATFQAFAVGSGSLTSSGLNLSYFRLVSSDRALTLNNVYMVEPTVSSSGNLSSMFLSLLPASGTATVTQLTVDCGSSGVNPQLGFNTTNTTFTTFIVSGTSVTKRLLIANTSVRTLTVNTFTGLSYVDFINITAAGSAAPFSGTALGDYGGNTNITFAAGANRYAVNAGFFSNTAMWSTTSGGSGGASVPLPQDTAIFDANSPAGVYTIDVRRVGTVTCTSGFTRTLSTAGVKVSFTKGCTIYGATSTFLLHTYNIANSFNYSYTLNNIYIAEVYADSNYSNTAQLSGVNAGYFSLTVGSYSGVATASSCNLGTNLFGTLYTSSLTISASSSITSLYLSGTMSGSGALNLNTLYVNAASVNIYSTGTTITTLTSAVSAPYTITFASGGTYPITNFNVGGTAGNLVTITASSSTNATLSYTGTSVVSTNYLNISKITGSPANKWYVGANSTNGGGNVNIYFTAPVSGNSLFFGSNF